MAQSKLLLFIFNFSAPVVNLLFAWYAQWNRIKQVLALRFVLGVNSYFMLESESLGSPCIHEGPLYYFPQPRYFAGGDHNEIGEAKVLTTALTIERSAKRISSETGGVPAATFLETWNYFSMLCKSLKVNVQL